MKNSLLLLLVGLMFVFVLVGLHNIDNAWNMRGLAAGELVDSSMFGLFVWDEVRVYNSGVLLVFFGLMTGFAMAVGVVGED